MPLTPEQRKVLGPFLEIYELTREPASFARWIQSNELLTALAHLVGTDGKNSFLLRCLASGVLRVALEGADADALVITGEGRAGTVIHDAVSDLRTLTIDADGAITAALTNRDGQLKSILAWPGYGARCPSYATEIAHAGSGVQTHDFGSTYARGLVITSVPQLTKCYRSSSSGGKDTPIGVASPYYPLFAACEERYLDLDSSQSGIIMILDYPTDGIS